MAAAKKITPSQLKTSLVCDYMQNAVVKVSANKVKNVGIIVGDSDFKNAKPGQAFLLRPRGETGGMIKIYLPLPYKKNDRPSFLQSLAKQLTADGIQASITSNAQGRKELTINGTKFKAEAKLIADKGGNAGNAFEKVLMNDIEKSLTCSVQTSSNFKYPDIIKNIYATLGPNESIVEIIDTGKKNTPRPLLKDGKGVYFSLRGSSRTERIGSGLSDITLKIKGGSKPREMYLSLKTSSTVTFANAGLSTLIPVDLYSKKMGKNDKKHPIITDPVVEELFKTFGIDPEKFRQIFTNYNPKDDDGGTKREKSSKEEVSTRLTNAKKEKLENLIKSGIGYDYYLIHDHGKNNITFSKVDKKYMDSAATVTSSNITLLYPTKGTAKRLDMVVQTQKYTLTFNIRNKQGGIYPTHLMMDYK